MDIASHSMIYRNIFDELSFGVVVRDHNIYAKTTLNLTPT